MGSPRPMPCRSSFSPVHGTDTFWFRHSFASAPDKDARLADYDATARVMSQPAR